MGAGGQSQWRCALVSFKRVRFEVLWPLRRAGFVCRRPCLLLAYRLGPVSTFAVSAVAGADAVILIVRLYGPRVGRRGCAARARADARPGAGRRGAVWGRGAPTLLLGLGRGGRSTDRSASRARPPRRPVQNNMIFDSYLATYHENPIPFELSIVERVRYNDYLWTGVRV